MAVFFPPTSTDAGAQFTFTASGDSMVLLLGRTLGSTSGAAIGFGVFTDVEITVLGTLVSSAEIRLPTNSSFSLAAGASFLSFEPGAGNSGLFLNGANSLAQINGTLSALATGLALPGRRVIQYLRRSDQAAIEQASVLPATRPARQKTGSGWSCRRYRCRPEPRGGCASRRAGQNLRACRVPLPAQRRCRDRRA